MAKIKSIEIPHYEMLYIISNKFSEDEIKPILEKVKKIIIDSGGQVTYEEQWGKKRLAYPIKNFNFGYYQLLEFDLATEETAKVDRLMRLMTELLRHQIVRCLKRTVEEIKQEKEEARERSAKQEEDPKEEKTPEKVNLQELDKKLDKILETEDLI